MADVKMDSDPDSSNDMGDDIIDDDNPSSPPPSKIDPFSADDASMPDQSDVPGQPPDAPPVYSYPVPGAKELNLLDDQGNPAFIHWLNMLNGMPPVGRAFSLDLQAEMLAFGMQQTLQDDYVYHWQNEDRSEYITVATNVDDLLIGHKGENILAAFDKHLERRCVLDGKQGGTVVGD